MLQLMGLMADSHHLMEREQILEVLQQLQPPQIRLMQPAAGAANKVSDLNLNDLAKKLLEEIL
jgi:hypothetical protein